jgi:uroporphyrinogen-III synthase
VVPCYATEPEKDDVAGHAAALVEEGADWIVFASGLAIEHLHERFDLPGLMGRFPRTRLAIASPAVQSTLDKLGLASSVVAQPDNVEDLVAKIVQAASTGELARVPSPPAFTRSAPTALDRITA